MLRRLDAVDAAARESRHAVSRRRRSPQGKGCATALRGYKDLKRLEETSGSERRRLRNGLRHEPMKRFACEAFASSVRDSASL